MDTKSHQDLRQLEGQWLSHDLSRAFSDNSVRLTTQEQTSTFSKSSVFPQSMGPGKVLPHTGTGRIGTYYLGSDCNLWEGPDYIANSTEENLFWSHMGTSLLAMIRNPSLVSWILILRKHYWDPSSPAPSHLSPWQGRPWYIPKLGVFRTGRRYPWMFMYPREESGLQSEATLDI